MTDPRQAKTLEEAAKNSNGTYNGVKLLSWLSEALNPGKGIPEEEVKEIAEKVIREKKGSPDEKRNEILKSVAREAVTKVYGPKK